MFRLLALFVLVHAGIQAQAIVPRSAFVMNFDYSRFRYTETEHYLEVSSGISPSLVTLVKEGDVFRGGVALTTVIIDTRTDSVVTSHRANMPVIITDTSQQSMQRALVAKLAYALPVGMYRLHVMGQDLNVPSRTDSSSLALTIQPTPATAAISDVDLCTNVAPSTRTTDPFYKNSYEVVPNPSLIFGSTNAPVVFTYAELYNLEQERAYSVDIRIIDGRGQVLKNRTRSRRFSVKDAVDVSTLNVTSIPSGRYRFIMSISDSVEGKVLSQTEKPIFIHNPNVALPLAAATLAQSAVLAGMTADELAQEFRTARYLATTSEISLFDKITGQEGRRDFLARFWAEVEKGRYGVLDMTRTLYLSRVATANQRFRSMGKEGWELDRGRVYILHGEPDEIERMPSSEDRKPYEIWHFYQIENGVQFIFVDRSGFGDYLLVHSTKRGELQDPTWERYLR